MAREMYTKRTMLINFCFIKIQVLLYISYAWKRLCYLQLYKKITSTSYPCEPKTNNTAILSTYNATYSAARTNLSAKPVGKYAPCIVGFILEEDALARLEHIKCST